MAVSIEEVTEELKKQLKMMLLIAPKVEVGPPGTIKQETIKAKRVLDLREKRI